MVVRRTVRGLTAADHPTARSSKSSSRSGGRCGDLEDLRERPTGEAFNRVESALRDTVARLRSTVSTLHPQVLAQVGLTAALGELARQHEQRSGMTVDTDLAEVGKPPSQALLYRAARELLVNAHKHSRAPQVHQQL